MLSLIYKDLRVNAAYMALALSIFALGALGAVGGSGARPVLFSIALVCATMLFVLLLQGDWRSGTDRFVHSLPVSRALVVKARYASSLLAGAAVLVLSSVLSTT